MLTQTTPIVTPPSANLLSEMDGLLFLGVQPESTPKIEAPPIVNPTAQQPTQTPQSNPVITAPPAPLQPVMTISPPPQPQLPSYNYSQISMTQPYQPYLPTAYTPPYATGYYSQPISYNTSMTNPYPSYGYQQPYSPMMAPTNPYLNQQQFYPSYQPTPLINNFQSCPQNPISYTAASLSISTTIESKPMPTPPPPASKNDDDFGDFKNGGSFDIQKVTLSIFRSAGCPIKKRTLQI